MANAFLKHLCLGYANNALKNSLPKTELPATGVGAAAMRSLTDDI